MKNLWKKKIAIAKGTLKFFNRKKEEVSFSDPDHETGVDDDDDEKEEDENNDEDNSQEDVEVLNDLDPNLLLVEKEDSNRSESDLEDAEDEKEEEKDDDDNSQEEVIPRRSGRETKTVNDPLRNIESTKGKSYTNISFKCVKSQKKSREPAKKSIFLTKIPQE